MIRDRTCETDERGAAVLQVKVGELWAEVHDGERSQVTAGATAPQRILLPPKWSR